ncbi:hypothetical protein E4T52_06264 [Aureobasidium sp. EXF-3400]|nr:hypothetical protein E4T51_01410 [Aureobasidium sp. EXF-12344]KAI4778810.1 hypothetical protein E4T52_06264 [Aureobasidium sp. EXF-3400]
MGNKVAASFGVVMAIFIVLALTFWGFSAVKHSKHDTASHNQQHHAQVDAWITRMRRKTWRHSHVDRDVEMQAPVAPPLPRRPESVHRVQFCDVPLTPINQGQRGVTPAGFF